MDVNLVNFVPIYSLISHLFYFFMRWANAINDALQFVYSILHLIQFLDM